MGVACIKPLLAPPLSQDEMSHALATMRVQEGPALIKDVPTSTNPLIERRRKKKEKARDDEPMWPVPGAQTFLQFLLLKF